MKRGLTGFAIIAGIALLITVNYLFFTGKLLGLPAEVKAALQSDTEIEVLTFEETGWLVFNPLAGQARTGLVLYPEGRMDIRTYARVGRALAKEGYRVVFLSRRLDVTFDGQEEQARIEAVMENFGEVENWLVGGHTWGAGAAVYYAGTFPERVTGVVLWAPRLEGSSILVESDLPVLVVYGTLDDENVSLVSTHQNLLPQHTVWMAIEGANRVQFADFGPMAADVGATISSAKQQQQVAQATVDFLRAQGW